MKTIHIESVLFPILWKSADYKMNQTK